LESNTQPVRLVERALDVLEALARNPRGLTLIKLSNEVGLNKATAYRILCTLIARNYVVKDLESSKYRLTMQTFELGCQVLGGLNIVSLARPHLHSLADATHQIIHLSIREGTDMICVYKDDVASQNATSSRIGMRIPMYCTGSGESILSVLSDEDVEKIWNESKIVRFTSTTITNLDTLKKELLLTRERGYAIDNGEHEKDIRCIASPILDYSGDCIGSISISSPMNVCTDAFIAEFAPQLVAATTNISNLLGYKSPK